MQSKKISIKFLLTVSVALLLFTNAVTYVLLLSKNKDWKIAAKRTSDIEVTVVAEKMAEHVYYDGDTIPCNQTVRHYSSSGRLTGSECLGDLLQGDKVVALLSTNNCQACAKEEIGKLLELAGKIGREHLAIVADFALHTDSSLCENFDEAGYYETDVEHLGLEGTPTHESVVVMLTQDGRIKTSSTIDTWTNKFADGFHEYLKRYFKRKEG